MISNVHIVYKLVLTVMNIDIAINKSTKKAEPSKPAEAVLPKSVLKNSPIRKSVDKSKTSKTSIKGQNAAPQNIIKSSKPLSLKTNYI
jgi:hypothetical protein